MDKQAEICETYQLKWASYNAYIHSCIATSLYTESYPDVALITVDGHQIMAHRFVLSYSSLFLAQVLKFQAKVTTALPLMIVMPPEIDYKCLKVLVRYMYSGEAKVTKEILNSVLKGGDILQIKGLYREKDDQDKNVKITQNLQRNLTSSTPTPPPLIAASTTAITTTTTTTATTSSVPPSLLTKSAQNVLNKSASTATAVTAIPEKTAPATQTSSTGPKFLVVQKPKDMQTYSNPRPKVLNFTIMQKFDKKNQNAKEESKRMTILNKSLDQTKQSEKNDSGKQLEEPPVIIKTEPFTTKESNLQYLMIKDEPIEWSEADMELIDSKEVFEDMTIKSEENIENYESESNEEEFSPLTCELCTETFTIPAEWVRHVQTHTDMLPAKRRRRDSPGDSYENDTFPELMCDMCQKSFTTPAEWVHHIQDTHTEFELHLSNKKNPQYKANVASVNAKAIEMNKKCTECDKMFPSNASMVIHRRRHTGEKPYDCQYCSKSFNVKSNLLRHLRTLHNKIVNSTEIENKDLLLSDNSN